MAIKTTKTTATGTKTASEIDLFDGVKVSRDAKREAADAVASILLESIDKDLNNTRSPVTGARFKALSKEYRKEKRGRGEPGVPNLELTGQMRDQLDVRIGSAGKIEIGVFGSAAGKADGHNNFSGSSTLPLRQFLPKDGQEFRSGIQRELEAVVAEAIASSASLPVRRLKAATSKSAFFDILRETFVGMSNNQIQTAVFTTPTLVQFLRNRGLLEFFDNG